MRERCGAQRRATGAALLRVVQVFMFHWGLVPCVGCASHPVAAADLLWVVPAAFPSSLRAVCRLVSRANNVPKAQAYFQQGGVGNPANPTYAKVGREKKLGGGVRVPCTSQCPLRRCRRRGDGLAPRFPLGIVH